MLPPKTSLPPVGLLPLDEGTEHEDSGSEDVAASGRMPARWKFEEHFDSEYGAASEDDSATYRYSVPHEGTGYEDSGSEQEAASDVFPSCDEEVWDSDDESAGKV